MTCVNAIPQPRRLVHLDFHTSEYIHDVGGEFDAKAFARTFKDAHVNGVTVFAKCHHGMCYYPTRTGVQHPSLKGRDLLGEQIEALHREGIACSIYTPVAWEESAARQHPEWRQITREGVFCDARSSSGAPGGWKFLNFVHPDYLDYIEAHVRELLATYDMEGMFFDILFFDGAACWSESSVAFRNTHGLMGDDEATRRRFEINAQTAFTRRFSDLIKSVNPRATVFYNQTNYVSIDHRWSVRAITNNVTHFELESLPSGFWGYHHFPRLARQLSTWGKPWTAQTGRFQRMWGDFGGIKPQAALEYECFRAQALGASLGIGDQLPPRGTLDAAAYQLIGAVYAQCETAESFYADSSSVMQVGIYLANYPGCDEAAAAKSLEAAVLMCEEAHYEAAVLDDASDTAGLDLIILPDTTVITPDLYERVRDYYCAREGCLLLSHKAGYDASGRWALDFLPITPVSEVEKYPNYWRATPQFSADLAISDRVIYSRGMNVFGGDGTRVLVRRVLPYFMRSDLHFSSHCQTPPVAEPDLYGAVIGGDRFAYFADPIFTEYRQTANLVIRDGWKRAMEMLIGPSPVGSGLPTTVLCVSRRSGYDLLVTLLHYVPVRKALDIDVIEERMSFAGLTLRMPSATCVSNALTGEPLKTLDDGSFVLPAERGRLLLRAPGYWLKRDAGLHNEYVTAIQSNELATV